MWITQEADAAMLLKELLMVRRESAEEREVDSCPRPTKLETDSRLGVLHHTSVIFISEARAQKEARLRNALLNCPGTTCGRLLSFSYSRIQFS